MAKEFQARRPMSPFDDIMHLEDDGTEWWSAREMMEPLGYSQWRNLENVIRKARSACKNSGSDPADHFADASKNSYLDGRPTFDVQMTRFGCYLVAMNGDPDKPEVAAAQRYFAMMTRAAEVAVEAPPPVVDSSRAWSVRFRETMLPHVRYVNMNHPNHFTVVTTLVGQLLYLEDEMLRHLLKPSRSDLPDGSVGQCWANERRRRGKTPTTRTAPLKLPLYGIDVELCVYENSERGEFEVWFSEVYIPTKLPAYLANKPEFKALGSLPSASVADHASLALTGRPANLSPRVRKALVAAGGFVQAGKIVMPPKNPQRTLFGELGRD